MSYEDPPTAKAAKECFDQKDFQGSKFEVSIAPKKPPINSRRGGMQPRERRGVLPPLSGGPGGSGGPGRPVGHLEFVEETEDASLQEGPKAPKGSPLKEKLSSTELETGIVLIRAVETRISPGTQNATSVRPLRLPPTTLSTSRW